MLPPWLRHLAILLALLLVMAFRAGAAAGAGEPPAGEEYRWLPLGPDGGHVSTLFTSPDEPGVVWAGMARGGVYRSADGGDSWVIRSPGLTVGRVNAVDRAPEGAIFAATDRGVFRLLPGDDRWQRCQDGLPDFPYASDVEVDPTVPGRVFASVSNGFVTGSWSLYRSDDGGETWFAAPDGRGIDPPVWIVATTPSIVVTASHSGVHLSTDGGMSSETFDAGLPRFPIFRQILGHPADPDVLYASVRDHTGIVHRGVMPYKSEDGGRSWRLVSTGIPDGTYTSTDAGALAIDPESPRTVYFGSGEGTFRSDDAGENWTATKGEPGDVAIHSLAALPGGSLIAGNERLDGLLRSADRGESWRLVDGRFLGAPLTAISPDPARPGRVVAFRDDGQSFDGGLLYSTDDGQTWTSASVPGTAERDRFLRPPGATAILVPGNGGLLRSTDGGASWQPFGPSFFSRPSSLRRGPDHGLYLASGGAVWQSHDSGATWSDVSGRVCSGQLVLAPPRAGGVLVAGCLGQALPDGSTVEAAASESAPKGLPVFRASILRSADEGATWSVALGDLGGLFDGDWAFSDEIPDLGAAEGPILASLTDPAGGNVWRSDDDGATWTAVDEFEHDRVAALLVDRRGVDDGPDGQPILAGTVGRGVLVSKDDGSSWQPLNEGLVSGRVHALALDPKDPQRIWAGTGAGAHVYGGALTCAPSDTVLCLLDRFRVEVSWTDFEGASGQGRAVPITANTGGFWFFGEGNLEFALKILDGRPINGHYWLFYGGLSTVRYTLEVTDLATGTVRRVENTAGSLTGGADTSAFPDAGPTPSARAPTPAPLLRGHAEDGQAKDGQAKDGQAKDGQAKDGTAPLRLHGDRFELEVRWRTPGGAGGTAGSRRLAADTGAFYFFDDDNLEVFAKVLDGRAVNGRYWLFFTGLSDVQYELVVTDTTTGVQKSYANEQGQFGGLADIELF